MDTKTHEIPFSGVFARINGLPKKRVALAATICFAILTVVVAIFHEPWLDEAQSWLIARDASYYDMLFVLPHVEGHVPFWWLLLSIPAKIGVPYEAGLKGVNILIAVLACIVFEYKSPFQNVVKIFFPFGYFFFYQYSVVARPYMLVILALFLAASTFWGRDQRPVLHLLSLILLCLADTYGIAIAGGIALGWTYKVIKSMAKKDKTKIRENIRQVICLAVLLISALLIVWDIMPSLDASATETVTAGNIPMNFLGELFVVPSEVSFTNFTVYGNFAVQDLSVLETVITSVISILIWFVFLKAVLHRDMVLDIVLPMAAFIAIGALYIYTHHFGLILMLGIYCSWISFEKHPIEDKIMPRIGIVIYVVSLVFTIMWTGFASINDILFPYWISRDLYTWIEANDLEDCKWFATWDIEIEDGDKIPSKQNTAVTREAVPVNPYLKTRKPLNLNNEGYTYALFRDNSEEQNNRDVEEWKKLGEPDLILCKDTLQAFWLIDSMGYKSTYDIVYVKECRNSWKTDFTKGGVIVYARRESGLDLTPDIEDMQSILGKEG